MPAKRKPLKADLPPELIEIGARIRALRERKGISSAEFAKLLGISVAAVNEIQQGRSVRQYAQFGHICRALGATPNAVLGFPEGGSPHSQFAAAMQGLLIEAGWSPEAARDALSVATEAAAAEPFAGLSPAQSAQAAAAMEWRRRKGR